MAGTARQSRNRVRAWIANAALLVSAACTAPGGPGSASDFDWGGPKPADPNAFPSFGGVAAPAAGCRPARGAEPLPARLGVIFSEGQGPPVSATRRQVFVEDLYNVFKSYCGGCHVDQGQGKFQVALQSFPADMDRDRVLGRMKTDDLTKVMPPAAASGRSFSSRQSPDPVLDLIRTLEQWFDQKKPADTFTVALDGAAPAEAGIESAASYLVSQELGGQLTNIGSCVPSRAAYASAALPMDLMDVFFEAATELPESLAQTDFTSLDGAILAQQGVVGFAPAYPLWSDGSAKMRTVRVPRGKSIHFDKETQRFAIPPNTRFYKTFLKKVVELNGAERYRKIETRLIVTRPDRRDASGTFTPTALFGAYAWNEEETEARLVRDPLHDGTPFKDRVVTYITDEPAYRKIADRMPRNLKRVLDEENPGLVRRYAIPGSDRCVECHMGSPSADFVLGFTPLQLKRRSTGEGGSTEPTGADELTQLQRLIDYGIITGLKTPSDVLSLEDSQGTRKARNKYELRAQAYLLGNCAHCHNPRGFTSVKQPLLADALDFLPGDTGGVFQFPLERVSPLRRRGSQQNVPIPYITPSLHDLEVLDGLNYTSKWVECQEQDDPFCEAERQVQRRENYNSQMPNVIAPSIKVQYIEAPWRSLIYRNVDTPFVYAEDFVIFPHMPRNTAGHDCRAPQILGDWMVSIPARRKNAHPPEFDVEPQPFVEVLPGDQYYFLGKDWAEERLKAYRSGTRYAFCPDTRDIVDHGIVGGAAGRCEQPQLVPKDDNIYDRQKPQRITMIQDGVPDKPHWIVTDLTDPPGAWYPRRLDWADYLIKPDAITSDGCPTAEDVTQVPKLLGSVRIDDDLRKFATAEIPLGLWERKAGCDFSQTRKVADFAIADQPSWSWLKTADPQAPVYTTTRGGAVFSMICVNCHGEKADAKGLLAAAISEMTGGDARVANFKDGLLGPHDSPGANWQSMFAVPANGNGSEVATSEDWAGRYMVWMALGGTRRRLPQAILDLVGTTPVLGERRAGFAPRGSANMLQTARELCKAVLPVKGGYQEISFDRFFKGGTIGWGDYGENAPTGLIAKNGDADLWVGLCNRGNRPVVRVLDVSRDTPEGRPQPRILPEKSFYWADQGHCDPARGPCNPCYPPDAEVMNHRGETVKGIQPDNVMAACLRRPSCTATDGDPCALCSGVEPGVNEKEYCARANVVRSETRVPWCPAQLFAKDDQGKSQCQFHFVHAAGGNPPDFVDVKEWATRGAINAGLAVFLYLQDLTSGKLAPLPPHNQCEKLQR